MITTEQAAQFANEWIGAWNNHDMDAVMAHYADDVVFCSPFIVQINNDPTGTIKDKTSLRTYLEKALERYPDLHFELYKTLASVNSIALYYKSVNNLTAAECMVLNKEGKVSMVLAHYAP